MLLVDSGTLLYHLRDAKSFAILDFIVKAAGTTFTCRHIAVAMAKVAVLAAVPDKPDDYEVPLEVQLLLQQLAYLLLETLDTIDAPTAVVAMWTFGHVGYVPVPELPELLAQVVISRKGRFSPRSLSLLTWSFARLQLYNPELFEALTSASYSRLAALDGP